LHAWGVGQRLQLSTASQDPLTAIVGDSRAENCGGRWADISVTPGKRGFLSIYTEFRFRQAPMIPFRVNERLAQRILESAGNSWPGERETETITAISKGGIK